MKKAISVLIIFCTILGLLTFPMRAEAEKGISFQALQQICKNLNYKTGSYWRYNGSQGTKESNDFVALDTRSGSAYTYYREANNKGGKWYQCAGFAMYLGYKLTGEDPLSSSNWTKYNSLDAAGNLQVGDIVGFRYYKDKKSNNNTSTHMAMVYSVDNGKYTFVQALGGEGNQIRVNAPFMAGAIDSDGKHVNYSYYSNTTMDQLKYIYKGPYDGISAVVMRYGGSITIPQEIPDTQSDHYTDASKKITIIEQQQEKYKNISFIVGNKRGTMYDGGCGVFSLAHAIQWLTGKKVSGSSEEELIRKLVEDYKINTREDMTAAATTVANNYSSIVYHKGTFTYHPLLNSDIDKVKAIFDKDDVIISQITDHYMLAVGYRYVNNKLYIQMVDSNQDSTIEPRDDLNLHIGYSYNSMEKITKASNFGQYWIPWECFSGNCNHTSRKFFNWWWLGKTGENVPTPVNTYTITWKNEDGSVIDTTKVVEGQAPTHTDPVKASSGGYEYTFAGWSPAITTATKDAVYTATFTSKKISDTTNDYDKVTDVYFPIICYQTDIKTEPYSVADAFAKNTAGEKLYVVAAYKNKYGNIWYGVSYSDRGNQIGYVNENNIAYDNSRRKISVDKLNNPSGTLQYGNAFELAGRVSTNVSIATISAEIRALTGDTIITSSCYPNSTDKTINIDSYVNSHNINRELKFAKLPEGHYRYQVTILLGWHTAEDGWHFIETYQPPELESYFYIKKNIEEPSPTDDPEVLPDQYEPSIIDYYKMEADAYCSITWLNDDGTIIDKTEVQYGSIPTHATPTKNPIDGKTFVFTGWTPTISAVTGDATYTAEYTETAPDTTTATGKCGDNLTWTLSGSTLTISGTGEMYDYEGNGPFRNLGITSAVISNGATSIGNCAFQDCGMLTSISIPDTVTHIGTNAFAYTSRLESISIPDSVTYIGPGAFYECQNLKSVQLPKHLTTINDYTFYRCTSLTGINIPNEVTEIGNNAFYYCNKMTNVTLSNKLKRIGDWAFYACNSLTNITIPDSVTTIGKSAFLHSQGLTSIAIPANVTQIGDNAFAGCRKMTAINVAADNRNYCSIDGVLFNKAKTELIRYPSGRQGEYSVREGVTTIANTAFYVTPNLTKVTLPESVTNIGRDAFSDCYNLSNATILNKTAQIGEKAFYVYLDAYEHWNDKVTVYCYADSTAHKYAIENNVKYSLLTSDPTVTEAPQTDLYFTYSGEGQDYVKTSNENKEFSVKRAVEDEKTFSLFTGIQVDGKNVDRSNYEATAGSVVIKLKAPYLETLTVGDHVMTVLFTDGKNDIPFTVSAAETPVKPTDPTKFADVAVPSNTFTFKKVWQGDHEDSIDFTLYKADGSVYHHGFDKRVVSKTEWKYYAYFSAPAACYVIEKPVPGYQIKYVNVGVYADVTDRCCDGGTIINKKVPKTGDAADFALWAGIIALGVVGLTTTVILTKRKRAHK